MNKKIKRVISTAICVCMFGIDISSVATAHRYQNYNSVNYYDCNDSNENEKSDSKTNWWWILAPLVPATIFFGGRYLIKNYRANNINSEHTSNSQSDFGDYEYEKNPNSQYNFDNYGHTEMSNYDNLDLKLEENDIKTLQTVNKLICSYDYWQAVVQKLKLNSSYCSQNFYDNIAKLCYNLCNPEELCKTFESLKLDDKKLIVSFLKNTDCTQKINQFIYKLELDLKSRKEKINRLNAGNYYNYHYRDQMCNKQKTVNILNSVSSEDFIRLYNQTEFKNNAKNGRLLILPEVVKNQLCINNELPDIDTALRSLSIYGVNEFSDIYNETYKTYDRDNLKAVSQKLKEIFHKYFADAKCPVYSDGGKITKYKTTEQFIFEDDIADDTNDINAKWHTRLEQQLTHKNKNIDCYKFYVKFLCWFDLEAKKHNVYNIKNILNIYGNFDFINLSSEPNFERIQNISQRKFAELWYNTGKAFCQYDGNRCYGQLPKNIETLTSCQNNYLRNCNLYSNKKSNPEDPILLSVFFDMLRSEIKENLKNQCFTEYYESRIQANGTKDDSFDAEYETSYNKILSKLFNIEAPVEIYHDFNSNITINNIARLMRDTVTPKFIRDILLGRKDLFDFEFKKQVASNFIKTHAFKENDLEILNNIYDGKLINEINDICNNANKESSPYDEEEKKFAKLFGELLSGKPVLSQLADCSYKFFDDNYDNITMDEYEALSEFLTDLSYVKNLNSNKIDSLFSLAYIFELKSQNYIDFVK